MSGADLGNEIQGPPLIAAMMTPEFYPHACDRVELSQTAASWLLFAGDYAYKVKKPLRLPFLDALTPARRYRLCHNEVRLSRRLAPDVYLGVRGIIKRKQGYALASDPGASRGDAHEFAVLMRRLPDYQLLARMILEDRVSADDLRELARTLAAFRAAAPTAKSKVWGSAAALSRAVMENVEQAREITADSMVRNDLATAAEYLRRYLFTHRQSLDNRARDGYVREGHGQLRCEKIFFATYGIAIIDCAEFAEGSRYCDAASEIASLVVSLELLERPDLAEALPRAYVAEADDRQLPDLLRFYKCCHAVSQGKLETITSFQTGLDPGQRIAARGKARRLFALAANYAGI